MGMSKALSTDVPAEGKKLKRARQEKSEEEIEAECVEEEQLCSEPQKKKKKKDKSQENQEENTSEPAEEKSSKRKKREQQQVDEPVDGADDAGVPVLRMDMNKAAVEFRTKHEIGSMTNADLPDPVETFDDAPFKKSLRKELKNAFATGAPTAIQAQGWPVLTQGSDLIAVAKTGSGKTLAFLLPAFRKVMAETPDTSKGPAVLVLAPTRELAVQIEAEGARFASCVDVATGVIYGGVPKGPQLKVLRAKPQVLVATPGRLVDFMSEGSVALTNVGFLVLDEADRMLDMGFEPQMEQIMKTMPAERQTLLFSATWPKSVQKLATKYLKNPVHVNVGETEKTSANKAITQTFQKSDDDEKDVKLFRYLTKLDEKAKIIIFANTKRRIDKLQKTLWEALGWDTVAMHGDKKQEERDVGLAKFHAGQIQVMCATDVCARGLDIKCVTNVVNYDMARDVESYVHRIGRTGRAGLKGDSFTFFNESYDMGCAPALVKIAKEAGQDVPEWLEKEAEKSAKDKKIDKQWKY